MSKGGNPRAVVQIGDYSDSINVMNLHEARRLLLALEELLK